MYTTKGKLAIMSIRDVLKNYSNTTEILDRITKGTLEATPLEYERFLRLNQDLHDHIVMVAERLGKTNVRGSEIKF